MHCLDWNVFRNYHNVLNYSKDALLKYNALVNSSKRWHKAMPNSINMKVNILRNSQQSFVVNIGQSTYIFEHILTK